MNLEKRGKIITLLLWAKADLSVKKINYEMICIKMLADVGKTFGGLSFCFFFFFSIFNLRGKFYQQLQTACFLTNKSITSVAQQTQHQHFICVSIIIQFWKKNSVEPDKIPPGPWKKLFKCSTRSKTPSQQQERC